jgi:hypothetical protein
MNRRFRARQADRPIEGEVDDGDEQAAYERDGIAAVGESADRARTTKLRKKIY